MGREIPTDSFQPEDFELFKVRLEVQLTRLEKLLGQPGFGSGPPTLGAEVELFLVNAEGRPLPVADKLLRELDDPRLAPELNLYNIEANLTPITLAGSPFKALREELSSVAALINEGAGRCGQGGCAIAIGILPTLREGDFTASTIADYNRYHALAAELRRVRGKPFHIDIEGVDRLELESETFALEGANTSLQLHIRIEPHRFGALYNAAQLTAAPLLAACGNSPTFLGRRLWEETRIELFRQTVDDLHRPERVSFGLDWLRGGAAELFWRFAEKYRPLLPLLEDETGDSLNALRLHSGTVWQWNRPVFDPTDGGHIRLEMRSLPAGPTPVDMAANAALAFGLALAFEKDVNGWVDRVDFSHAAENFRQAARFGLGATLLWPQVPGATPTPIGAARLVECLLSKAEQALVGEGVDAREARQYLSIIAERVGTGQTGSAWQRRTLTRLEARHQRREGLALMFGQYRQNAATGEPVHLWG